MVEMLYPSKPNSGQIVGVDVFRFLANYTDSLSRDFKSRVKNALKVGQAVSVDLALCTRQYHGFEKFVTHWTPMKDEKGHVTFVVLTLGSVGVWREGRGLERSGLSEFPIQVLSNNYGYEVVEIAAGGDLATLEDANRDTVKLVGSSWAFNGPGIGDKEIWAPELSRGATPSPLLVKKARNDLGVTMSGVEFLMPQPWKWLLQMA
jgi:hypothetical protein